MNERMNEKPIDRVLWIGYTTHDEAVAKGIFVSDESWTYDLPFNFGRPFSNVGYAVPFGKANVKRCLTPQITYRERGPVLPRLPKILRFLFELPAAIRFLDKVAKETDPQVIQVCGPNLPAVLVWLVPRLWRVPKMCFIEAFWETLLKNQPYMPWLVQKVLPLWYKFVYSMFDGYCGTPSLNTAYYQRLGMDPDRIHPWVQPIDLASLANLDSSQAPVDVLQAPQPRIASVGRLHPEKLSIDALEIFLAMHRAGFEGSLVLVGDGQLRSEIERRAEEAGVRDRVILTGQLPLTDGYRAVKACQLYLATMQGSALLETMAAGLPIVAYDNETHRSMLVNGHTGLLTPNRDIEAAAAALQALVFDKNKAARIGDSAKAEVELRYGHEAMKSILADPLRVIARKRYASR